MAVMKDLIWAAIGALLIVAGAIWVLLWMVPSPSYANPSELRASPREAGRQRVTATRESCGGASWYGYTGRRTANGEPFDGRSMTAASRTLPFGSRVKVTDQATGASVVVRINDRGPFVRGRIIDLSSKAADRLGSKGRGVVPVCLTPIG